MITSIKQEKLHEKLKKVLVNQEPGDSFMSIREIMRRFDVSQITVTNAMEPIIREGLLEKRKGLGMFVTSEVKKYKDDSPPIIALMLPRWVSDDYSMMENIFLDLQEEYGICGEVIHYDVNRGIMNAIPHRKLNGLIVDLAVGMIEAEEVQALKNSNIPFVLLGEFKGLNVNMVNSDDRFGATVAADHLIRLGHRKVAVMVSEPWSDSIDDRVTGFSEYCKLQGAEVDVIDLKVKLGLSSIDLAYEYSKNNFQKKNLDFSGLFVVSEQPCLGVLKALHENHVSIPEELSIVSFGNCSQSKYFYPALTTVDSCYREQIGKCIEMVNHLANSDKDKIIKEKVLPQIIVRESTSQIILPSK